MNSKYIIVSVCFILLYATLGFSCKKFIETDAPRTDLVRETVFKNNSTANAAMLDVYVQLKSFGFANGSQYGLSFLGSISSDEMNNYVKNRHEEFQQFNDNNLEPNNFILEQNWASLYRSIYQANSIIEGLATSAGVSTVLKNQLEGEAKFIRAFCHFYLVNLWGDVPLVLSTDYKLNNSISRTSKDLVYQQIISDLKEAQNLLSDNYLVSDNERVRANKGAATAMLARVYLFNNDWLNAENEAKSIINNNGLYGLEPDLMEVFRTTSKEVIFQLWSNNYPTEFSTFFVHPAVGGPRFGAMRVEFVDSFVPDDQRRLIWIQDVFHNGTTFYRMAKYISFAVPPDDFSTVLKVSEQYLIRAEARAKQGKITGPNSAETDINIIRTRAGLDPTTAANQSDMLLAIENERKHELFGEWGHRWLDLKRTNRASDILSPIKPNWQAYKELFPIPEPQLINNPNIIQNPGY